VQCVNAAAASRVRVSQSRAAYNLMKFDAVLDVTRARGVRRTITRPFTSHHVGVRQVTSGRRAVN